MSVLKHVRHTMTTPVVVLGLAAVTLGAPDASALVNTNATTLPTMEVAAKVRLEPVQKVAPPVTLTPRPEWVLPLSAYRLTGRFGASSGLWSSTHTGLDFAAPSGTPIRSIASGVVSSAGYDGAYGYKTVVTLPDGTEVWYCHQDQISVSAGERLHAGEVLGYVGTTGNTTGAHLHLEVRPPGAGPVDPYDHLAEHDLFA